MEDYVHSITFFFNWLATLHLYITTVYEKFSSTCAFVLVSCRFEYFKNFFHYEKSVRNRRFSDLHFPAFGLNTERYSVCLHIQFECEKIRTTKTLNTDTFHVLFILNVINEWNKLDPGVCISTLHDVVRNASLKSFTPTHRKTLDVYGDSVEIK